MVYLERTNESEEANVVTKLLGVLFWQGGLVVGRLHARLAAPGTPT
jgi:hypothetical protein